MRGVVRRLIIELSLSLRTNFLQFKQISAPLDTVKNDGLGGRRESQDSNTEQAEAELLHFGLSVPRRFLSICLFAQTKPRDHWSASAHGGTRAVLE